jgi:hypothetical protein
VIEHEHDYDKEHELRYHSSLVLMLVLVIDVQSYTPSTFQLPSLATPELGEVGLS